MKKILLSALALVLLFSFTRPANEKESALVNKEHGLYIFVDSRPVLEYDLIGEVKSNSVQFDYKCLQSYKLDYSPLKKELFWQLEHKQNKEKFKDAEALIIYPDQQKADVIKFK